MPNIVPYSNFHELNLDWLLEKVKALEEAVAGITGSAEPSDVPPVMDGTASAGSSANYSRGDHVHPTDTTRASQTYAQSIEGKVDDLDHNCDINFREIYEILNFSTAAPLVDGVATPGSSQYPARADHVHPTDTSRASQSDFDTLKGRVDNMPAAQGPYDGTPEMDGVGAAGLSGLYSRGDHKHPSDTSKLGTAGGILTGFVDDQFHNVYFNNNAVGWRRIAAVPNTLGTIVEFLITRKTAGVENHKITFDILSASNFKFWQEYSRSYNLRIDKIRYTDAGAVDIHFNSASSTSVGVSIMPHGAAEADAASYHVYATPAAVNDAPAGETVILEYTFVENSIATVSNPTIDIQDLVNVYRRSSRTVDMAHYVIQLQADTNDVTVAANTILMTGLIPSPNTWLPLGFLHDGTPIRLQVTPEGTLKTLTAFTLHVGTDAFLADIHYPIVN